MSATDLVEGVRIGFSGEGGFDGLDGQAMADALVAAIGPHATDDFQCHMMGAGGVAWQGMEGLRAGWRDFLEAFDYLRIIPGELRENGAGDAVVEFVRMESRPKGTTATFEQTAAAVWRVRDERVAAIEFHLDRDAALRSGGLA